MSPARTGLPAALPACVLLASSAAVGGFATPTAAQSQAAPLEPTPAQWRADLDTMVAGMKRRHTNLFHTIAESAFDSAAASLRSDLDSLDRSEIVVGLAHLGALVGDGHTRMWLNQFQRTRFHQLPLRLYRFADGWHVRAVDDRQGWAAGLRVEGIGDVGIEEAFARVSTVIGQDNPQTALAIAPAYLVIPEVLHALNISAHPARVRFRLLDEAGERRDLWLDAIPGRALDGIEIGHNPPGVPYDPNPKGDGVRLTDALLAGPPLWLAEPDRNHVVEYLPEPNALYVRLSRVGGTDDEGLTEFLERTYDQALEQNVDRYVLDLRLAWGGNNQLVLPAVLGLVRRTELDRDGRIWVLIGRHTFSATTTLVTLLHRMTNARFVGEPTGGSPNYYADARPAPLPLTGLLMGVSSLYWQDSDPWDDRPWHAPELAVDVSASDYIAGRDPVLEAALNAAVEESLEARLRAELEAGDAAGALRAFAAFREDPRRRWIHEVQASPDMFLSMGDDFMVTRGHTEAGIAAWTAGLDVVEDPAPLRARLRFVDEWSTARSADRAVAQAERERIVGDYGRARILAEADRLVYETPSGNRLDLIPLEGRTFAVDQLPWLRVRFEEKDGPPGWLELVFYDGSEPTHVERSGAGAP